MNVVRPTSQAKLPPEEVIRLRAYEIYEQRGRGEGHELDDWLEAEREVLEDEVIKEPA